jgi:hypothetical protein
VNSLSVFSGAATTTTSFVACSSFSACRKQSQVQKSANSEMHCLSTRNPPHIVSALWHAHTDNEQY